MGNQVVPCRKADRHTDIHNFINMSQNHKNSIKKNHLNNEGNITVAIPTELHNIIITSGKLRKNPQIQLT